MKSYIKKTGEEKSYDQKMYNRKYYEKNREKIAEEVYTCICCNKEGIQTRNRHNHERTLKHKLYAQLKEKDSLNEQTK